jgi:hypothetical protein
MDIKIGQVVKHKAFPVPVNRFVVIATMLVTSYVPGSGNVVETLYRCRMYDGMIRDFFPYEFQDEPSHGDAQTL